MKITGTWHLLFPNPSSARLKWLMACLLMAPLVLTGCDKPDAANAQSRSENPPVEVTLSPVEVVKLPLFIEASGTLLADETMTISSKVSGRVLRVTGDLGDQIAPGQTLATIDPTDYKLAIQEKMFAMDQTLAQLGLTRMPQGEVDLNTLPSVRRAISQQTNAKARLERLQKLHAQKLISDQDYSDAQTAEEIAKSEYDVAVLSAQAILATARTRQSELETARQRLADTQIIVPQPHSQTAGQPDTDNKFLIAERMTSEGEYVREGTPLFRLVDDNPIRLRIAVPERHSSQVKVDQPVAVRVQAFDEPFQGKVTRISPEINPANRTFQVEVAIANPDHRLKPGGFAMGAIQIPNQEPAILVPQDAVTTFAGVSKVFAVEKDVTKEILVTLGDTQDSRVVITKGLDANSVIISPLPARTTGGMAVKVISQQ